MWSWGHHYLTLNEPAIAPARRGAAEQRDLPPARAPARPHRPVLRESDEELLAMAARSATRPGSASPGCASAAGPRSTAGRARARTPRAASQRRRASSSCAASGWPRPGSIRCRSTTRPARSPTSARGALPARAAHAEDAPLPQLHVRERPPPARARSPSPTSSSTPTTPRRAASRTARRCASTTTAASFTCRAIVSDDARAGVLVAPMGWWNRDYAGGHSPQATTPQRLTRCAMPPTFNDNRVEISAVEAGRHVL